MFAFDRSYAISEGKVVDVLSFNSYVYLKKFLYSALCWKNCPKYLEP